MSQAQNSSPEAKHQATDQIQSLNSPSIGGGRESTLRGRSLTRTSASVLAERAGLAGPGGEKAARRLIGRLVRDGLLQPTGDAYSPRRRARAYLGTPKLYATLARAGQLPCGLDRPASLLSDADSRIGHE